MRLVVARAKAKSKAEGKAEGKAERSSAFMFEFLCR